jgi:hypothetical protein
MTFHPTASGDRARHCLQGRLLGSGADDAPEDQEPVERTGGGARCLHPGMLLRHALLHLGDELRVGSPHPFGGFAHEPPEQIPPADGPDQTIVDDHRDEVDGRRVEEQSATDIL